MALNALLKSNNPFTKIGDVYNDLSNTVTGFGKGESVPWDYAIRNKAGRDSFDAHRTSGSKDPFEGFGEGTLSKKRIAALGLGGYAIADGAYRTVSGGSAYRNNSGRKDLVGVPFI
jgi:hypothetical protein